MGFRHRCSPRIPFYSNPHAFGISPVENNPARIATGRDFCEFVITQPDLQRRSLDVPMSTVFVQQSPRASDENTSPNGSPCLELTSTEDHQTFALEARRTHWSLLLTRLNRFGKRDPLDRKTSDRCRTLQEAVEFQWENSQMDLNPRSFGGAYRKLCQTDAAHERGGFKPFTNGCTLAPLASKVGRNGSYV